MAATTHPKLTTLLASLDQVSSRGGAAGDRFRRLSEEAAKLDLQANVGWISLAGRASDGSYQVDFNVDGAGGYGSNWPSWAYEAALPSVLHDKKIYVISDGPPVGSNLLVVLIFQQNSPA